MSVKTIDIFGPKASAKVDPKLLEQKQQGKTEGFDQLLQEIVQQDEKTQKIALPKAKMSKQLQRPLPPKLDNQERDVKENGDKAFFLEDIPKG